MCLIFQFSFYTLKTIVFTTIALTLAVDFLSVFFQVCDVYIQLVAIDPLGTSNLVPQKSNSSCSYSKNTFLYFHHLINSITKPAVGSR